MANAHTTHSGISCKVPNRDRRPALSPVLVSEICGGVYGPQPAGGFFDRLPAELRNMVYHELFKCDLQAMKVTEDGRGDRAIDMSTLKFTPPDFLLTSRQAFAEAAAFYQPIHNDYFRRRTFVYKLPAYLTHPPRLPTTAQWPMYDRELLRTLHPGRISRLDMTIMGSSVFVRFHKTIVTLHIPHQVDTMARQFRIVRQRSRDKVWMMTTVQANALGQVPQEIREQYKFAKVVGFKKLFVEARGGVETEIELFHDNIHPRVSFSGLQTYITQSSWADQETVTDAARFLRYQRRNFLAKKEHPLGMLDGVYGVQKAVNDGQGHFFFK